MKMSKHDNSSTGGLDSHRKAHLKTDTTLAWQLKPNTMMGMANSACQNTRESWSQIDEASAADQQQLRTPTLTDLEVEHEKSCPIPLVFPVRHDLQRTLTSGQTVL